MINASSHPEPSTTASHLNLYPALSLSNLGSTRSFCLNCKTAYQLSNLKLELSRPTCRLKFQSFHSFCITVSRESLCGWSLICWWSGGKQWVEVKEATDWPVGSGNINFVNTTPHPRPASQAKERLIPRLLLKPSLIRREMSLAMESQIKSPYLQW